ncbi:E3 ubiquitin-protein ligase NHLRC1-like [Corythoichthys intestinalis]|uniref:E3 ubiquitin-protein ligase NHLRC1-like n=1 Tax=Corythoichthys intestinalis TaxID=161448 RepID=UPI0025A4FB55|nr:E3 ubiquitin-protein ligase NHLRC1-like [Corythoichthys intestinalis]XP_061789642.1 E3 ubiquitin-protein ligase NHLRC1-like [Nerophis lumbriciformis]
MAHSCSKRGDLRQTEGTLREIQVNLLECKVCFEKFNAQQAERRPQNLSCGHVLCAECIRVLTHPVLRKLECPFCRQLCPVDATSHCQVLCDLQELLLFSPVAPCLKKETEEEASGGSGKALSLCLTFGGWGTLINPTGLAVMQSSGTVFVVHDGEKRVVVFAPQGKRLHTFGQRGHASEDVCYPLDVAVTPCGHVVVTDAGDKAVKVFTSRGTHVITVKGSLSMPWGVDTDSSGHILVSDMNAGTLSRIKVDYRQGITLQEGVVVTQLECPKAVACCRTTSHTAVMEHVHSTRKQSYSRLTVFTSDFHILYQTDTLSVNLKASVKINMSTVTFDKNGHLIVVDSLQGMIWTFGSVQHAPVLTPLVAEQLIRPVGLLMFNNTLMVVDGGDHTVKVYS